MLEEVVRRITLLERAQERLALPERSLDAIGPFLALPGLVGFWPMSSVQRSTGNVYDLSGQARTLTYNGNPTFNYTSKGMPYIALDGVGDYLSRTDETDLDVLGTETIFAAATRGLTMGGWFYSTGANPIEYVMAKWLTTGNQMSYRINRAGGKWFGSITTDGSTIKAVTGGDSTANQWYGLIMRFVPSTTLDLWCNGTKYTQAVGIPASIFNSTAQLLIGRDEGGTYPLFTGRSTLNFLCASALPDSLIGSLFEQMRGFFGV